jgi:acetyl-CoA acetyltransferase
MAALDPVIVGIGRSPYSRNSGRTTAGLAVEACRNALSDAGLPVAEVDGIITYAGNDSASANEVAYALGLPGLRVPIDIQAGGNAVTLAVAQACASVSAGMCNTALVFRSLNSRSGKRLGTFEGALAIEGEGQYGAPHGYMAPGQWFAMWSRRYMHEYGTTYEDLGQVAIVTRAHAVKNEAAIMREPISMAQYLASRWIYDPFRLYDCALEADGACAILVTTRERARDLAQRPIAMLGQETFMSRSSEQWPDMGRLFSAHVAPTLWSKTGLKPRDVQFACIYDCFTFTTVGVIEDFGFCDKGGAGDYYASGKASYGGEVVMNPHGGLLSEAYIHGMNHHYEAVLQLRGQAGERQVAGAELALVTAGTGPYGGGLIYARS